MTTRFDRRQYDRARLRQETTRLLAEGAPVPARITLALDSRGLWGPDVDRACGVEEPTVDLWEAGELAPTAEQVRALADLTGYPVAFFYQPHEPIGPAFVCTRTGPRGQRCVVVDDRPDATVTPLPVGQLSLFGDR